VEKNPVRRLYITEQVRKVAAFELVCFRWADGATAVSAGDAEVLRSFNPALKVRVIENGVDTDYFRPQERPVDRNTIVFTGSMDWRPNQDAALYFAAEIFPILQPRRPRIRAYFVGRNPSRGVMELARIPGLYVTGAVDDVRPYLAQAGAFIVPLRIGGGSRLKILEALAMGKAVVSTTIGAEGLRVKDGENIVIRDGPREFAEAVLACLDDEALARRIAGRGRELVLRSYRWDELGQELSDFLCETIKTK
jgi:glycosyltransferase involved in cell wall biosynthesis